MGWLCVMGSVIRPQQLPKVERDTIFKFLITTAPPPPRTPPLSLLLSPAVVVRRPPSAA